MTLLYMMYLSVYNFHWREGSLLDYFRDWSLIVMGGWCIMGANCNGRLVQKKEGGSPIFSWKAKKGGGHEKSCMLFSVWRIVCSTF